MITIHSGQRKSLKWPAIAHYLTVSSQYFSINLIDKSEIFECNIWNTFTYARSTIRHIFTNIKITGIPLITNNWYRYPIILDFVYPTNNWNFLCYFWLKDYNFYCISLVLTSVAFTLHVN